MAAISDKEDLAGVLARMQGNAEMKMKQSDPLEELVQQNTSEAPNQDVWRLFLKKKRVGSLLSKQMQEAGFEDLIKRAKFRRVTDRGEQE